MEIKELYVKDEQMPKDCTKCKYKTLYGANDWDCGLCQCDMNGVFNNRPFFDNIHEMYKNCPLKPLSEAQEECEIKTVYYPKGNFDMASNICTSCNYEYGYYRETHKFCLNCGARIKRQVQE